MSIFGSIVDKIFHHPAAAAASPATPAPAVPPAVASPAAQPQADATPAVDSAPANPSPAASGSVDVGAVLSSMAGMASDGGGNYQSSIVDLLKLLGLDSSLGARKELAQELGVQAGEAGSAEQNIALHRAVMDKLAENGGVVPDSLRH